MKWSYLLCVGLGLVIAVSVAVRAGEPAESEEPAEAANGRLEALESRMKRLRDESSRRQRALPSPVRSTALDQGPSSAKVAAEQPPIEDSEEGDEQLPLIVALEESFEYQAVDESWAPEAHRAAEQALERVVPEGSSFERLECRASLCRAEISHQNRDGHEALTKAIVQEAFRWPGPGSLTRDESGGDERTIAFFGRVDEDVDAESVWRR